MPDPVPEPRKRRLGTWLSIAGLAAAGALTLYYIVVGWSSPDGREVVISGHGWVAMILGGFFTLLVGGGLIALMIFSHRRGHDR